MDEIKPVVNVENWKEFRRITANDCDFLKELDKFPDAVLVTGCQRSGTTILSRIITDSEGMVKYWFGHDDELDAALILSGLVEHHPKGRYCFQTTFLDNCYEEYFEHSSPFKIVWSLRNPYSTIYSLLYNWPEYAFDNTFRRAIAPFLTGRDRWLFKVGGNRWFNRIKQACYIYNAKVSQLPLLQDRLGKDRVMAIDYDDFVVNTTTILADIYRFVELEYNPDYSKKVYAKSLNKWHDLSRSQVQIIERLCEPVYNAIKSYLHYSWVM